MQNMNYYKICQTSKASDMRGIKSGANLNLDLILVQKVLLGTFVTYRQSTKFLRFQTARNF